MIKRQRAIQEVQRRLRGFPVVAMLGPRQCGKTTLARQMRYQHFFDLENPRDLARLDQPQLALEKLRGLIVIDEVQRKADLFPLLRFLVDQKINQKYLILGSASRELVRQSSESLAGRISYYHLGGFTLEEVGLNQQELLWLKGGLPRSFLAKSNQESYQWRESFITTFLEKDIPQLGIKIPAPTLRRFWMMISHYHGQVINFSEMARSFGVSDMTVRKYLEILTSTFVVRLLMPWHANVGKRIVKNPKLYLRDSGLFHNLQSMESHEDLLTHPKLGASWEGFALEQVCQILGYESEKLFFWATHAGAELDLFWQKRGKNWGIEFKYSDAPRLTKSMQIASQDLTLERLWVIYPGESVYELNKKTLAIPLKKAPEYLI